mmetsp:Transcript_23972/g.38525  ORF Transcript_23972/g.38525 Transcript_23972/m.38525 type:complete len:235 (+) Transcript_23972:434-1138(+)
MQRDGNGSPRRESRVALHQVRPEIQLEDRADACDPADRPNRAHPQVFLPPPRHQARQLPHGPWKQQEDPLRHRPGAEQALHAPHHAGAHPVPRQEEIHRNPAIREHLHAPGNRAEQARRPRIPRLHADVLQPGQAAVARAQGAHEAGEIRQDRQPQGNHPSRDSVQGLPQGVRPLPQLLQGIALRAEAELRVPPLPLLAALQELPLPRRLGVRLDGEQGRRGAGPGGARRGSPF